MLELHGPGFLLAATEMALLRHICQQLTIRTEILVPQTIETVQPRLRILYAEAEKVGARLACVATERLVMLLEQAPQHVTVAMLSDALRDIESRFADHLMFVRLFVIPQERASLFEGADKILNASTAALFPSIWFDCEEAAKSLCLGRFTASVFHSMRMLEIAIASLAKRLEVPDPAKSSDRNWGIMLRAIQVAIDQKYPKAQRLPGTDGAKLEAIHASLDAIKNPWRNATMHVESIYTAEEANHILVCTSHLMDKMAALFDENGQSPAAIFDLPSAP